MRFVSTRGYSGGPTLDQILLGGVAPDGGLYLPETWPHVEVGSTYPETVANVLARFLDESPLSADLYRLTAEAFSRFRHPDIAPLRRLSDGRQLLELFWGPTLAFKDHALQVVGRLFERALALAGRRTTILVATSGDTGSAAIAACLGSHRMRVVVLYPKGRVSNFQRRQMTTVQDENVQAVAVEGTFDDCQSLVKQAFADEVLGPKLTAMNSINFARVAAQAGYYLWAAAQHPDADFVVPTGNFGNAFSGWAAREMGAPIARLVIANNANHGLSDLVNNGFLVRGQVTPTLAPSMDIQIPSNLERYLYEVSGRDPNQVRAWQENLRTVGRLDLSPSVHQRVGAELAGAWFDDRQITGAIRRAYEEEGVLLDPHTAVAWEAGNARRRRGVNQVVLATADPVKFSSAILAATGLHPDLPVEFAQILSAPERTEAIANDYAVLLRLLNETHSSNE